MQIGTELNRTRLLLGLTQQEMADDVITPSYYSRVENNQHEISAEDLLAILNEHQVSLYDFFNKVNNFEVPERIIFRKLELAFNDHDIKVLKRVKKNINDPKIAIIIDLMIATLEKQVKQLDADLIKKMQSSILKIGSWDAESLWRLNIVLPIYSFEKLRVLMTSVFNSFSDFNFKDSRLVSILANLELNYLRRALKEKDVQSVRKTAVNLMQLPSSSKIVLQKLIAQYYLAVLDEEQQKVKEITTYIKQCGYEKYFAFFKISEK